MDYDRNNVAAIELREKHSCCKMFVHVGKMSNSLAPLQKEERETRSTALMRCASQGQLASAIDLGAWLQNGAGDGPVSSNQPSQDLPFQRWFKFKEAFSPHLVVDLIRSLPYRATSCLDPFGGSGTTALACQFLGISPITIEVNPLLADVIEAKLHSYDPSAVMRDIRSIRTAGRRIPLRACEG